MSNNKENSLLLSV